MKKILVIVAAIAVIIAATNTCAEASPTPTPPPFAIKIINLDDLHLDYGATVHHKASYSLDYSQLLKPVKIERTCVPGRIPTFPFVAVISAVGVTAAIIYIATDGNRKHTRQAIWGCVTGMVVGGVVKWLSVR